MRIAVIADTHGTLPEELKPILRQADEIWHLGDFCDLRTLQSVRQLGPAFTGVLGNNDYGLDLPMEVLLERCGKTFRLIHIPPRRLEGADFLLHGHTHVPRDENVSGTRVLNPGTIGKPNKGVPPAWAWLGIEEDGSVSWELQTVPGKQNGRW